MKNQILTALLAVLFCSPPGFAYFEADTKIFRWDQASILSGFLQPTEPRKAEVLELRSRHEGLGLSAHFWANQARAAPKGLFFVIPGTGGNSSSGQANFLAEELSHNGFDAMVLSNPFSTDFQKTFSRNGIIGFPQRDMADFVLMLNRALKFYSGRHGKPRTLNIAGISLGATYVTALAGRKITVPIEKFIAINPPVDLTLGMDALDGMIDIYRKAPKKIGSVLDVLFKNLIPLLQSVSWSNHGVDGKNLARIQDELPSLQETSEAIIGYSYEKSLKEIARGLSDTEKFQNDVQITKLYEALPKMNFRAYRELALGAMEEPLLVSKSLGEMAAEVDYRTLVAQVLKPEKLFVFHSRDDFLTNEIQLSELQTALGDHLMVFSSGGHCGVLWTPQFLGMLKLVLANAPIFSQKGNK